MKKILFMLATLTINIFGQNSSQTIDSLDAVILRSFGEEKVDLLIELSYAYRKSDPVKGIEIANRAQELAEELEYDEGVAWALNRKSLNANRTKNNSDALEYAFEALTKFESTGLQEGIASSNNIIGIVNYRLKRFETALKYYFAALKIYEEIENPRFISICLSNIGLVYRDMNNTKKALEYYLKLLDHKRSIGDKKSIAISLNNISILYKELNDYQQALEYSFESLKLREEIGDKKSISIALNNIGNAYDAQGNYKKALEFYERSLSIKQELGYKRGAAISLNNIGKVYDNLGDAQKAIDFYLQSLKIKEDLGNKKNIVITSNNIGTLYAKQGQYGSAVNYYNKSLQLALSTGDKSNIRNTYKYLADMYSDKADYRRAYEHLSLFEQYKDSVYSEENDKMIAEVHAAYELEKKENENSILKKDNEISLLEIEKQTNLRNLFIAISILVIIIIAFIYFRYEAKKKANRTLTKVLEKLNEVNSTKDKFFSIIAHDLRSPFNSLIGFSELLIDDFSELEEEQKLFYLEEMNKTSRETLLLLDNLLTWARSQRGKITINKTKHNLFDFVDKAVYPYKVYAGHKNIAFSNEVNNSGNVFCDKETISITIANLFSNAVKFTPKGGTIKISSVEKEMFVEIHIKDNGVGIDSETMKKLFKLDNNVSTRGTNDESGTGLGLVICKEFVEKNGGKIWVESQPGEGSDFIFTLPSS